MFSYSIFRIDMVRLKLYVNNIRKIENVIKIWFDSDLWVFVRIIRC